MICLLKVVWYKNGTPSHLEFQCVFFSFACDLCVDGTKFTEFSCTSGIYLLISIECGIISVCGAQGLRFVKTSINCPISLVHFRSVQ